MLQNKNTVKISFIHIIVFIFVLLFIYLYGINDYGLLSKDEPRYAGCALELMENHNWIIPKFNFQDRFDKPILFYWLIAISYKIFGVNEFASRLPSAISAILLIIFTWYLSVKVLGKTAGFISALILATSVEYIFLGRRAATDMVLCLFFSSSLYSMYLGYFVKEIKMKIFWTFSSGIFAGLAILTKGPIAILLPMLILTLFLLLKGKFDIKHLKVYFLISFIAIVVSAPWYIAVHNDTNGEFTKAFFFTHNLQRFTAVVGEHPGPIWFYFPVLLLGFMPWTFFLLHAILNIYRRFMKKSFNKFIFFSLIWVIVVFTFFSLCKTKLATYILLLFPPLSFITGYWINILGKKYYNLLKLSIIFLSVLLVFACSILYFFVPNTALFDIDKKLLMNTLLFTVIVLSSGLCYLFFKKLNYISLLFSFVIIIALPAIFTLTVAIKGYYNITFADLRDFASAAKTLGATEIISFGGYKPLLVYYGRVPVDFESKKQQVKKIKNSINNKENIFLIGYLTDLNKPIVKENKELFRRLQIIKSGRKYFLGEIKAN